MTDHRKLRERGPAVNQEPLAWRRNLCPPRTRRPDDVGGLRQDLPLSPNPQRLTPNRNARVSAANIGVHGWRVAMTWLWHPLYLPYTSPVSPLYLPCALGRRGRDLRYLNRADRVARRRVIWMRPKVPPLRRPRLDKDPRLP
jgi:hypothetical protein